MITSEEYYTIQAVKARLSNKATAKRLHVNPDFPLRGTVSCVCGVFLTAGWRKGRSARYPYYQCKNPMCAFFTHGIRKSHLEEQFLLFLESITLKDKILRVFKIALLEALNRDTTTNERDRRHYEQELTRLTARKEHLLQMRTDEEISKDEYLGLKRKIDIQLAALTASHTEVSFQDVDMETVISDVTKWMHSIARGWSKTNNTAKKQRLQKMVLPEGITYDKTSGAYCTAVLPCVFRLNRDFSDDESAFVAEVGRNSHQILKDLYDMWKLAQTQEPNEFAA